MDSAILDDLDSPAAVLESARADRVMADAAEARILQAAAVWVDQHPPAEPADAAWPAHGDVDDEATFSVPAPRWTAVPEFAAGLGLTTGQGQDMMLEAMEGRHRLPLCWAEMLAGKVAAWRIRRIARATVGQPDDVAGFVDRQVAPIAHKVGVVKLDKIIDEAMLRLYPEQREQQQQEQLDARFVRLFDHITHNGVAELQIRADLADALEFEAAIATIARRLGEEGDPDSLDVRRSKAVGIIAHPDLARRYLSAPSATGTAPAPGPGPQAQTCDTPAGANPASDPASVDPASGSTTGQATGSTNDSAAAPAVFGPRRVVVLNVHVSEAAVRGLDPVGRLERGDQPITEQLIRDWCGRTDSHLKVYPVRDLNDHQGVGQYEAPDRLKSQVEQAVHTCVFPWCARPASRCDKDHNVPHDQGGATCSCNLAPLCRRHHRLKTHTAWRYETFEVGTYLWTSPFGKQYLRDNTGTLDVSAPNGPPGQRRPTHPESGCFYDG